MTIEQDFLPFATGGGANVVTQSAYAALSSLSTGYQAGVAASAQLNKTWRQSSIMAAVVAQFIVNQSGQPAIDDGTTATLLTNLATAVAVSARQNPVLADTGAANAYVVANLSAFSAYPTVSGLIIDVSIANANTTASTLNVDGLGTKPILGLGLQPLQGSELIVKGVASLMYVVASTVNGGNGAWILLYCTGGALQIAPATAPQHAVQLGQVAGVVGSVRNLVMSVTAASATATLTADEIIVETALGGLRYCLASFNKTINLATTGAGGMDTGTAPVSGYVAIYAIWNPTTSTAALLATNSATLAGNIYGGGNMPSGYTASALVSVVATNASSQFALFLQKDRKIWVVQNQILATSSIFTNSSISIAAAVPKNALTVEGFYSTSCTVSANVSIDLAPTSNSSFGQKYLFTAIGAGATLYTTYTELALITAQTVFITTTSGGGTPSFGVYVSGYTF